MIEPGDAEASLRELQRAAADFADLLDDFAPDDFAQRRHVMSARTSVTSAIAALDQLDLALRRGSAS